MIPPLSRPPVAHPREQFQQVIAIHRRPAEDSEPPARQVIGEPGYQPPVRRKATTGNDTIEHGEAPAGPGHGQRWPENDLETAVLTGARQFCASYRFQVPDQLPPGSVVAAAR